MCVTAIHSTTPVVAQAEQISTSFDKSNVLNDLRSGKKNGEPFNILDYPQDGNGIAKVIDFVEYGYSYHANKRDSYGLYVYVYNPTGETISQTSDCNKIQIAVKYDGSGNPIEYHKFKLKYINKSVEPGLENLFYKFKVVDEIVDGTTFSDRVSSGERRYDVSGIELIKYGSSTARDYAVGGTFFFTGYAQGLGHDPQGPSTLQCRIKYLETISLDVEHTFYRTETSSKGKGYQNQLDTVYFAVPNRFFDDYGKLQRITAEWYEFKTKDIIVTSYKKFYDEAKNYIGLKGDDLIETIPNTKYAFAQNLRTASYVPMADWGWNLGIKYNTYDRLSKFYYLFYTENIEEYDPYEDLTSNSGIEGNDLHDYIASYNKTQLDGKYYLDDYSVSADLFEADIDDCRKIDNEHGKVQKGYSYYDFDTDVDLQVLNSWQGSDPSFWDNWMHFGFWDTILGHIPDEQSKSISPIYKLKDTDLQGDKATISDTLLVNYNDVDNITKYYNEAKEKDCSVILFRFAASDYYSAPVDIIEFDTGFLGTDTVINNQAYRCAESVFLSFDIIQLSFTRNDTWTVIPVVSNPIDIIDGLTPPVQLEELSSVQTILAVILLIVLFIVLFPILRYVIEFLIWLICLPVRLIGLLVKGISKLFKRDK